MGWGVMTVEVLAGLAALITILEAPGMVAMLSSGDFMGWGRDDGKIT